MDAVYALLQEKSVRDLTMEAVAKRAGARGTFATVEPLESRERVDEVARMLGGLKITEATRRHAEEMLQNARTAGTQTGKEKGKAAAGRS